VLVSATTPAPGSPLNSIPSGKGGGKTTISVDNFPKPSIEFADFSLPHLTAGGYIEQMQL
jgi:hypothetical protein